MTPKHLRYTDFHIWVRDDGGSYVVGLTEYAAEQMGDITYVELPVTGEEYVQDEEVATVESSKTATDILAPVGGRIVDVNDLLETQPELINDDPYNEGWLFKLRDVSISEFDSLMSASDYDRFLKDL